jgi:putative ABC transport system permease protein
VSAVSEKPYLRLIRAVSLVVPRSLRADWAREWEAEILHRTALLARWHRLGPRGQIDLLRRSAGAFADALWLQPRRLEEEMIQDVRFGARMLAKDKTFTFFAVLALALGIGATTAVFSVVEAALLHPLPYDDARVVAIVENREGHRAQITPANFLDWREQQTAFEHLSAYFVRDGNVRAGGAEPRRLHMAVTSADFFEALGVRPVAGRTFRADEETAGHAPVAVVGYGLWQRDFGGDPAAVGKTVAVDGEPYEIVGVMPAEMRFPKDAELWVAPRRLVPEADIDIGDITQVRGLGYLGAVARLRPGVTLDEARAEMELVTDRLRERYPETNGKRYDVVMPLRESLVGDARPALAVLGGAVACVLLIACANVANLLLARSAARQKELAIRSAIGASRLRSVRQLLTESVLLSLAGGAAGLAVAALAVRLIVARAPDVVPPGVAIGLDARALAFTLAVSVATGLVFGVAPAVRATAANVDELLRDGGRGTTAGARRARLHGTLIVAEVALSVMLLAGAGLLARSFVALEAVPLGFEPDGVVTARLAPSGGRYADDARKDAYYAAALERLGAIPSVEAAGAINTLPLAPGPVSGYVVDARPALTPDKQPGANRRMVTGDYFRAVGMRLLAGRSLDGRDAADAPLVAVVNEAFARQEFPGEDPVGRRLSFGTRANGERVWLEIVGVVADVRSEAADVDPKPEAYVPLAQSSTSGMSLAVRTSGDPAASLPAIRDALASVDPEQPIADVATLDEVVARSLARPGFYALLLGAFAAIALAMAAAGVYGVTSYSVSQRAHEIGVRMALGATGARVVGMILGQGARLTLAGLAVGVAGALAGSRLVGGLLFGVTATDPGVFAASVALLAAAALVACAIPARRATKVDPVTALRGE